MKHEYAITGMTCGSCQKKVENALVALPDVVAVTTDRTNATVTIEMSKHLSLPALQAALADLPKYTIAEINPPKRVIEPTIEEEVKPVWKTYYPLLLITGYLLVIAIIAGSGTNGFSLPSAMRIFMAGFFLTFSFFKMLDLQGFADSYAMYDVVAKKTRAWGYVYPFVELGLGIAYAIGFYPIFTNSITLLVMTVSSIGVLQSVLNKRKIKCACLGAVFNLPMSTVTIIEDATMLLMSIVMLTGLM